LGDSAMLFGTCNCNWNGSPISRRGLLCSGGAGFVTALIGTLASSSRTAQAQALASKPPEVDSLAVRIITDNQAAAYGAPLERPAALPGPVVYRGVSSAYVLPAGQASPFAPHAGCEIR